MSLLLLLQGVSPAAQPELVRVEVGEVSVVAASAQAALATRVGEASEAVHTWAGLGRVDLGRIQIILARNSAEYRRLTQGAVPEWSAGVSWPDRKLIVIRLDAADPFETLRHELAHLALHQRVQVRLPRWFDEGYAVYAAGELGRVAGLRLNLAVATGRIPTLRELDGALRNGPAGASDAYALAGSAVATLVKLQPEQRLEPLLDQLASGVSFDQALLTMGFGPDQFEADWHRVLRRSYNLGAWIIAGGGWLIVTIALMLGVAWRRYQDRPRRAALDTGWVVPMDDIEITTLSPSPEKLDQTGSSH